MRVFPVSALFLLSRPMGAGVRLESSLEPREARVGDRLTLQVRLEADADTRLRPFTAPQNWGPFELLHFSSSPEKTEGDRLRWEFTYTLAVFDVGVSTVPSQKITFESPAGPGEVRTPEIPVTIRPTLPPEAGDIRDIRGPQDTPRGWGWLWGLLALAVAGSGWRALRHRRARAAGTPALPTRPPHEIALEDLNKIEALLAGSAKAYYSRLADVLRAYLEGRFRLPALDRTTSEIWIGLRDSGVPSAFRHPLREALDAADLAKFARLEAPVEERLNHLNQARAFVTATRPAPAVAEELR